jgi:ABC-type branched-subunit amino acid transport system permease subunit
MLILGGAGSLGGVILGALVVNVSLEILRTPGHASWIFYLSLLALVLVWVRPWKWAAIVLGGTLAFGYAVYGIVSAVWPRGTEGDVPIGGLLGDWLDTWMIHPSNPQMIANYAYVVLVFAVLGLTLIAGWKRWLAMIPTLYLSAFVWDNRLVMEPSITRLILIGVILIVLMNLRPQGLLGTARVEIV